MFTFCEELLLLTCIFMACCLVCCFADPFMAWLDFSMDRVRTNGGSSVRDYTASDTFVEDWRTHRIWDWLNHHFWKHVPTDRRMVHVEVGG
jgi:hypothetical protein